MTYTKHLTLLFIFTCLCFHTQAQSILGIWKVIGYETLQERGLVEIYEINGEYRGRVISIIDADKQSICKECKGDKRNQAIIGMDVIWGLHQNGGLFADGTVLDVENGKEYKCEVWVENGNLMVRGYYLCFYNTQKWIRASPIVTYSKSGAHKQPSS